MAFSCPFLVLLAVVESPAAEQNVNCCIQAASVVAACMHLSTSGRTALGVGAGPVGPTSHSCQSKQGLGHIPGIEGVISLALHTRFLLQRSVHWKLMETRSRLLRVWRT